MMTRATLFNMSKAMWVEKIQLALILGILFFIPISPAAPNLLGALLIIVWLWQGEYRQSWERVKSQPIFWAFLVYLVLYPVSLLWSSNHEWGVHMVERHMLYLMFPFVFMAVRHKYLRYYLSAFILGVTFTEVTSYLVWLELLHIPGVSPHDPTPFYHHVEYNPMLAWAIYLLMYAFFFEKHSVKLKLVYAVFITTMTINMFITGGRGGQVTYFVIVGLLFLQYFSMRQQLFRGAVLGIVFIGSLFALAYHFSPLFQSRADLAVQEVQNYTPTSRGSVAYRLHMYINTTKLSFDRPVGEIMFGSGVGDFPEDYTSYVGPDAVFKMVAGKNGHSHPHNQYLYQLGALGVVGLMSLLAIFWTAIRVSNRQDDGYQHYRWAFLVFMAIIMLSDSLLLAHPTSVLFIVFSALLYAQNDQKKRDLT